MTESFDQFAARELPSLLRYAAVLTGDQELARDLVQDVMLKTYSRWSQISATTHPRAYVRTMVTNAHLSWRRRWAVRHVLIGEPELLHTARAADDMAMVDERANLRQALETLPRQQRAALVLRYYEGLADDEIATTLGCSVGTARGYISRGLATLRVANPLNNPQEIR